MPANPPGPANPRHNKYNRLKIGLADTGLIVLEEVLGGTPEHPPGPTNLRHPKYNQLKVNLFNTLFWFGEELAEDGDPQGLAIVELIQSHLNFGPDAGKANGKPPGP